MNERPPALSQDLPTSSEFPRVDPETLSEQESIALLELRMKQYRKGHIACYPFSKLQLRIGSCSLLESLSNGLFIVDYWMYPHLMRRGQIHSLTDEQRQFIDDVYENSSTTRIVKPATKREKKLEALRGKVEAAQAAKELIDNKPSLFPTTKKDEETDIPKEPSRNPLPPASEPPSFF